MILAHRRFLRLAAGAVALAALTVTAAAQAPSLAGKNVQMIISAGTGGPIDLHGRLVARHIGKHLPGNPTVVPQNMPGAGGFTAANYIYNVAPKDGTVMGIIGGPAVLGPIRGDPGARFDPTRITLLGTPTTITSVCIAYTSSQVKVKTLNDLYEKELTVGSPGIGGAGYLVPKTLSALLGMKFKVVVGFTSVPTVFLAMERGEVDGFCGSLEGVFASRPDWVTSKKVAVLFQGGTAPNRDLKDVPFVNDVARTLEDRQAIEFLYAGERLGRPFVAPPSMAPERMKMLQDGFVATMNDPDFLADAKKQKLDVIPIDGEQLTTLVRKIYATPKPVVDKVTELVK
jgi:tripartite-type tricarboxylate transporter receptor subunit TctC